MPSTNKQTIWWDDLGHFQFYDAPRVVEPAVDAIAALSKGESASALCRLRSDVARTAHSVVQITHRKNVHAVSTRLANWAGK